MKKHLSILLCIVIALSLLAGCAQPPGGAASAPPPPPPLLPVRSQSWRRVFAGSSVSESAPAMPISQSPLTLTFFCEADAKATVVIKDYSEMEGLPENGGIKQYHHAIHPSAFGQGIEQFNLMVASVTFRTWPSSTPAS